jgi:hypothetical protein
MKLFSRFGHSIPVLTYHSLNVLENCYSSNDHLAFESDLKTIEALGLKIISLHKLLDWHEGIVSYNEVRGGVAITLDDGSWLDYYNILHPTCGTQISMFNLLDEHRQKLQVPNRAFVHVSSFVISSPKARKELETKILLGNNWWGDDWWAKATKSGLMNIECHSWDHLHDLLEEVQQEKNLKGDFREVKTFNDCVQQVNAAADYIEKAAGIRPSFFAYPWGQASEYLVEEFMPNNRQNHRLRAAFSIEPKHVTKRENRWFLPRYVCGRDWKSPEQLEEILA